jgi:hypothetical protein
MSPEQARASNDPIDHRTDIYSLGATLYELATGQPIFAATSAHEVLSQILNTEPRAPRQLTPDLPRDFETIILKCLAKEPALRYASAQALADDLRAFLEGRAISARPPSVPERVVRWARKHRRTSTVAAFSAGVSLVLAVGGYLFWQDRQQARLGHLTLTTDSPNLLAEVVDADGRALTPVFPVPTPGPVPLPAGAHQLRLSASGLLSETWPVEITRRQTDTHFVQLNPRWLWPPGEGHHGRVSGDGNREPRPARQPASAQARFGGQVRPEPPPPATVAGWRDRQASLDQRLGLRRNHSASGRRRGGLEGAAQRDGLRLPLARQRTGRPGA